jgi:hypothetical protein
MYDFHHSVLLPLNWHYDTGQGPGQLVIVAGLFLCQGEIYIQLARYRPRLRGSCRA